MRELDRIHRALAESAARGEAVVLATVLEVAGSVYRGEGARMVVRADCTTLGAVSGGCLEADIVARSGDLLASGVPDIVHYDTRGSDDELLGLGMGCRGLITVLLEPLRDATLADAVAFLGRLAALREPVTVLVRTDDAGGGRVGDRSVRLDTGSLLEGDASLAEGAPGVARERVRPAPELLVCGAGSDAIPLVAMASELGFRVKVVDHRAIFATSQRFSGATFLIVLDISSGEVALDGLVGPDTLAVVMAHSAAHDRAWLGALLDAGARYIGVLGPRRRTLELLGDRAPDGVLPSAIHSPVGLDLGAETPEEIALSITAELLAVVNGRTGGPLRARGGPIHPERSSAAEVTGP